MTFDEFCDREEIRRWREGFWQFCIGRVDDLQRSDTQLPANDWEKLYQEYIL